MFGVDQMFCCNSTPSRSLKPYSTALLVNPPPLQLVLAAPLRKWVCVGGSWELSWLVMDWSAEGGAADHLAWGNMRVGGGDMHGSVLSMSWFAAAAAFRLVG